MDPVARPDDTNGHNDVNHGYTFGDPHLNSDDHRKTEILQLKFDYLLGIPGFPDSTGRLEENHRGLRGWERFPGCEAQSKGGSRGYLGPVSQANLKAFWGANLEWFGTKVHDQLKSSPTVAGRNISGCTSLSAPKGLAHTHSHNTRTPPCRV